MRKRIWPTSHVFSLFSIDFFLSPDTEPPSTPGGYFATFSSSLRSPTLSSNTRFGRTLWKISLFSLVFHLSFVSAYVRPYPKNEQCAPEPSISTFSKFEDNESMRRKFLYKQKIDWADRCVIRSFQSYPVFLFSPLETLSSITSPCVLKRSRFSTPLLCNRLFPLSLSFEAFRSPWHHHFSLNSPPIPYPFLSLLLSSMVWECICQRKRITKYLMNGRFREWTRLSAGDLNNDLFRAIILTHHLRSPKLPRNQSKSSVWNCSVGSCGSCNSHRSCEPTSFNQNSESFSRYTENERDWTWETRPRAMDPRKLTHHHPDLPGCVVEILCDNKYNRNRFHQSNLFGWTAKKRDHLPWFEQTRTNRES